MAQTLGLGFAQALGLGLAQALGLNFAQTLGLVLAQALGFGLAQALGLGLAWLLAWAWRGPRSNKCVHPRSAVHRIHIPAVRGPMDRASPRNP